MTNTQERKARLNFDPASPKMEANQEKGKLSKSAPINLPLPPNFIEIRKINNSRINRRAKKTDESLDNYNANNKTINENIKSKTISFSYNYRKKRPVTEAHHVNYPNSKNRQRSKEDNDHNDKEIDEIKIGHNRNDQAKTEAERKFDEKVKNLNSKELNARASPRRNTKNINLQYRLSMDHAHIEQELKTKNSLKTVSTHDKIPILQDIFQDGNTTNNNESPNSKNDNYGGNMEVSSQTNRNSNHNKVKLDSTKPEGQSKFSNIKDKKSKNMKNYNTNKPTPKGTNNQARPGPRPNPRPSKRLERQSFDISHLKDSQQPIFVENLIRNLGGNPKIVSEEAPETNSLLISRHKSSIVALENTPTVSPISPTNSPTTANFPKTEGNPQNKVTIIKNANATRSTTGVSSPKSPKAPPVIESKEIKKIETSRTTGGKANANNANKKQNNSQATVNNNTKNGKNSKTKQRDQAGFAFNYQKNNAQSNDKKKTGTTSKQEQVPQNKCLAPTARKNPNTSRLNVRSFNPYNTSPKKPIIKETSTEDKMIILETVSGNK